LKTVGNWPPEMLPDRPVNGDVATGQFRYSVVVAFVSGPEMAASGRVNFELLQ